MTSSECCGNCAYLDKRGKRLWCPFHDEPVAENMVCDDFLDEYQSPQWKALASGMNESSNKEKVMQFTGKDVTAYIISLFFILLCIACFLM